MVATKKKKAEAPKVSEAIEENGLKRLPETRYVESGNVGVDIVLTNGRGIPLGANILMYGLPGTGKTTIICDLLKRMLDSHKAAGIPFRVHYIDSESSRELLRSTGVMEYVYASDEYAPQQVIYHEHINGLEQLEDIYRRIADPKGEDIWSKDIYFNVIDSINRLSAESQLDLDESVNKGDYGDDARTRKKLEKKWFSIIQGLGITQFWVSQMSTKQNAGMFEDKKKPAVTDFDIHNMDIILRLVASRSDDIDVKKIKYNTIQGEKEDITKYVVKLDPGEKPPYTKNRYGQNLSLDVMLWRGRGIINAYVIRKMLVEYGYLKDLGQKKAYAMSQELADFLGPEALEYAKIKDINKIPRKPNLNRLCSKYDSKLKEFLKLNNLYKMKIDDEKAPEEEDDGLF